MSRSVSFPVSPHPWTPSLPLWSFSSPLDLLHLLPLLSLLNLPPACLFISLLVTLSLHPLFMSLSLPQSRSVTGEFPELITGGYPRVQWGPAHLQAKGAREGCLITFSTAWLKTAHKSLVHMGLCTRTCVTVSDWAISHSHMLLIHTKILYKQFEGLKDTHTYTPSLTIT